MKKVSLKDKLLRPKNFLTGVGVLSFSSIVVALLMTIALRFNLGTSQDIREQASTATPKKVVVTAVAPTPLAAKTAGQINLTINTKNQAIAGMQLVWQLTAQPNPSNNQTLTSADLFQAVEAEVLPNDNLGGISVTKTESTNGYTVKLTALVLPGKEFKTGAATNFAWLKFAPQWAGKVQAKLIDDQSFVTLAGVNPPTNVLMLPAAFSFDVAADTTTPTPTPTVTATPTPAVGGVTRLSCNEVCTSSDQCAINHYCYNTGTDKRCRLATNPSNSSCVNPPDQGLSKSCNEYCADSRECAGGLVCWYNQCRLASNIESSVCAVLTKTQQVAQAQLCNRACSSNDDCAINLRCYQGACRLAINPTSPTCSLPAPTPVPVKAVIQAPQQKGDEVTPPPVTVSPTVSQLSTTPEPTSVATIAPTQAATGSGGSQLMTNISQLVENLQSSGRLLPVAVLVIGLVLLIVSMFLSLFSGGSGGRRTMASRPITPSQQPTAHNYPAPSTMVDKLKSKGVTTPQS